MTRDPEFVGRQEALAELTRAVERARSGRGTFVLVRGEPGIGKTTLVEHATAGHTVLWGRASPAEVTPELYPWIQLLRAADRAGFAVDVDAVLASAGTATLGGSGQERYLRVDAIIRALRTVVATTPAVVVLDDLQWADAESLVVLELLRAELAELPLALVATARDDSELARPRPDATIELGGLDADAVAALLTGLTGEDPPAATVQAALRHTGGNPYFLAEVARLLQVSGRVLDAAAWQGVLPDGVRTVIGRRLAQLPAPSRTALVAAAVLGSEIDPGVLADVLEVDRPAALTALGAAAQEGLVRAPDGGPVVFAHALVREVVLAGPDADAATLHALHARAASVLEAATGGQDAAAIAAHHWSAGARDVARSWSRRAADQAYGAAMYDEAAHWLTHAIDGREPGADLELALRLGDAWSRAGRTGEARELFLATARAARSEGESTAFARAALGVGALGGGFEIQLLDVSQVALLEEAIEQLTGERSALRALLLARLSVALSLQEEHERRVALADEAVELARAIGDDAALVHSLAAWSDAHAGPAWIDERIATSAEMVAAAVRCGDPELELLARRFRIVGLMEAGQLVPATAEIRAFGALADALHQPAFRWYARLVEGMLAFLHGDLALAQAKADEARAEGRLARSANAEMLAAGGLQASILREQGDWDGYLATMTSASAGHHEVDRGMDFIYPLFLAAYGGVEPAEVQGILDRLPPDLAWFEEDSLFLFVWTMAGNGAAFCGDEQWVARARTCLEPHGSRFALDGTASVCVGPVAETLGRLAAATGDDDEARRWFIRALEIVAPMDAPLLQARIERALAASALAEPPGGAGTRDARDAHDAPVAVNRFARDGETWWLVFDGASARLRDAKGLRDLAVLLARPGSEVHCLDLVAAAEGDTRVARPVDGDLGPALDARARRAYEARIRDLTEQIEEADAANDLARAAALDDERALLLQELGAGLGLLGRARGQGSDAERARKAVAMRIRDAIGRIERDHPALAHHLRHSVRTGAFCVYRPEHPVTWHL